MEKDIHLDAFLEPTCIGAVALVPSLSSASSLSWLLFLQLLSFKWILFVAVFKLSRAIMSCIVVVPPFSLLHNTMSHTCTTVYSSLICGHLGLSPIILSFCTYLLIYVSSFLLGHIYPGSELLGNKVYKFPVLVELSNVQFKCLPTGEFIKKLWYVSWLLLLSGSKARLPQ